MLFSSIEHANILFPRKIGSNSHIHETILLFFLSSFPIIYFYGAKCERFSGIFIHYFLCLFIFSQGPALCVFKAAKKVPFEHGAPI